MKGVPLTPNGALFKTDKRGGFCQRLCKVCIMIESKYQKTLCYRQSKNMKILKTLNYSKIFQSITTSRWLKRFHSIVLWCSWECHWFRYYDLLVAEAITTSGQLSIRWIERAVNQVS